MGKYELKTDKQKAKFAKTYIPKGISWRLLGKGENPFAEDYKLGPNEYPIHSFMFKECGLRLPLGSLMVDFLRKYHLALGQLFPNAIRIICGIEQLNKNHGTQLGLNELRYCYILTKKEYGYSLKAKHNAPSLVLDLPNSHKGIDSDAIVLIGDIVPNPIYKPTPRRASGPGDLDKFDRPKEYNVEITQINAIANYDSGSVPVSQSQHPRAVNQLLRYPSTRSSFSKRDMINIWLGPEWTFWQKEALFIKYKIQNSHYNRERAHELKKGNKNVAPASPAAPTVNCDSDLQLNYLDIPWCNLNKDEKSSFKVLERLAISEAKDTKKPIPFFPNKNGPSKYLSFNAILRGKEPLIPLKKSKGKHVQ